jgi:hypothetical protein
MVSVDHRDTDIDHHRARGLAFDAIEHDERAAATTAALNPNSK